MQSFSVLLSCAFVACIPSLGAQSYTTSPRGLLTTEGAGLASIFGAQDWRRHMLLDGEQRGVSGKIKEIAFRQDYNNRTTVAWTRTWSNVELRVSNCDVARRALEFGKNPLSTPTLVFSSSVTWQNTTGYPSATAPAPWGGGGRVFPFSSPWTNAGTLDICLDFAFHGMTDSVRNQYAQLDADGPVFGTKGRVGNHTCADTGQSTASSLTAYMSGYHDTTRGRTHFISSTSSSTAPSSPVVHGFFFAGNTTGVPFAGMKCGRLFVNPTATILFQQLVASVQGIAGWGAWLPYDPTTAGNEIWIQAGWDDSKTGSFKLTHGYRVSVPTVPPVYMRFALHNVLGYTWGYNLYEGAAYTPIIRYTR